MMTGGEAGSKSKWTSKGGLRRSLAKSRTRTSIQLMLARPEQPCPVDWPLHALKAGDLGLSCWGLVTGVYLGATPPSGYEDDR